MADRGARAAVTLLSLVVATVTLAPVVPGWAVTGPGGRVSAEELRSLAERAASDPAALARLREIDQVDGRPVDLRQALGGVDGDDLRSRLRVLASTQGDTRAGPPETSASPRDEARRILDEPKFEAVPTPRPFQGVLRRLGGWLRPIGEPLGRLWDRVETSWAGRLALGGVVVGVAVLVSAVLIRRRTAVGLVRRGGMSERRRRDDPVDLERRADTAEREGDLELAFRLRFRAGLLRLDEAGVIPYRPALTTGELTRSVPSPHLHGLASALEEIAYGGRPAGADDLRAARADWARVLEDVRGR